MFQFLHGYTTDSWEHMVRHGLVGENDGIRLCHSILSHEDEQFNEICKVGGKLYNILKERKCPFYVDRIQGGGYMNPYPYDPALLAEYKKLLGDNFYGFQMHEWLSNYGSDLNWKIGEDLDGEDFTAENIEKRIRAKFPGPILFIEAMTPEEMASFGRPHSVEEYYNNMTAIFKKRQKVGDLVPADSYLMAYGFELEAGCTRLMPEVGAQIPDTKLQVCYARGMTRKEGLHFGTYYEPWGGDPFSTCTYFEDRNEWNIHEDPFFPFRPAGPNGGSSRSLQKRIFLYSYLSNAEFMSEEWGLFNTFEQGTNFELSIYGKTKKYCLDFVRKYADVGNKLTPIAAVLPADLKVLNHIDKPYDFIGYEVKSEKLAAAKAGVKKIFVDSAAPMGGDERESKILRNSELADALDMLNRDDAELGKYDYLVDLTGDADFADKFHNTCAIDDLPMLLEKLLPCNVKGGLHWMVNERVGGGYYLTVFNHSGVMRSVATGEYTLPEETKTATVTFKNNAVPTLLEGDGVLAKDGDEYHVTVPAGGFAFIQF